VPSARDDVLARVRAALRDVPRDEDPFAAPYEPPASPPGDPVARFVERVSDYRATVREAGDVAGVVAQSDVTGESLVLHPLADKLRPRTVYDAKFSLPYCLATRLVHGALDVASFTEDAIRDPAVLAVTPRVRHEVRRYAAAPDAFPGGVRVHTVDGRTLETELRHQRGAAENPLGDEEVRAKYRANAALALSDDDHQRLEGLVLHLEQAADVRDLQVLRQARVGQAAAAPASPGA
jgi:hypothetical protein